jgi:hypothetical protein
MHSNNAGRELQSRDVLDTANGLEPPVLFPLEVMVHPLDLRFKYHFSGDKPTNRLDKVTISMPLKITQLLTLHLSSLNISLRTSWILSASLEGSSHPICNQSSMKRPNRLAQLWNGTSTMLCTLS